MYGTGGLPAAQPTAPQHCRHSLQQKYIRKLLMLIYQNLYLQQIQIYTNMNIFKLWHNYYILLSKIMYRL